MEVTLIGLVSKYLLRYRKITAAKAYELYGTMWVSSIIADLRARGWPIKTTYVETTNRYGIKIRYGVYTLPKKWQPKEKIR